MTKEDLTAALNIRKDLSRLEDRLSDLEVSGGLGSSFRFTGQGGQRDPAAVIAGDLAGEIDALREKLKQQQEKIVLLLDEMELDETEKKLMIYRYVKGWEWKDVAIITAYSLPTVMKKHAAIIKRISLCDDVPNISKMSLKNL